MSWWTKTKKYVTFNKNPLRKVDDFIVRDLGGYGNVAKTAGIIAAGVLTGGAAIAAEGVAFSTTGAILGGVAGAGIGAGSMSSGIEAKKAESEAKQVAAEQKAEVDKANAQADRQRRAQLFALRKQVGAVDVGAKSSIYSGSSSKTDKVNDIILG